MGTHVDSWGLMGDEFEVREFEVHVMIVTAVLVHDHACDADSNLFNATLVNISPLKPLGVH